MTFREKLADWISGGAYRKARNLQSHAEADRKFYVNLAMMNAEVAKQWSAALRAIAAMETASANATVKRMAKTAREALE